MDFVFAHRDIPAGLADSVWHTQDNANGVYVAAAQGYWSLLITTNDNGIHGVLQSPCPQPRPVAYAAGNQNVCIRFKPGVRLGAKQLRAAGKKHFWLDGKQWLLPTLETSEQFVAALQKHGTITQDPVVRGVVDSVPLDVTLRSVQRHFIRTVGLTPQFMQQIARADKAVEMLQQGKQIPDVVYELGFADQAHMTRVVKRLSGCTPGDIVKKVASCRLRSIQGYGPCGVMRVQNITGGIYAHATLQNSNPRKPA